MSKQEIVASMKPLTVIVNGVGIVATPKVFSTGSIGYNVTGKVPVELPDGTMGKLQVTGNLILVGSKDME